ncbi:DUF6838 family protein [Cytobacillus praedii]|uniref:phage tail terminator family protein n=1 Tax=Cytobacillus praedii TaxID=1742358 RepID=UPI002E1AE4A8|nr:hypothetical protein [Cytobacillus praedii]
MITYKDIKLAINSKLINKFNIEVNSNDVKEGFIRPSFFVSLDNIAPSSTVDQVEKSLTVRINYFPTDKDNFSLELLDIQEQLENLFNLKLEVLDRLINIDEVNALTTDGVLEFSFDISFYDGKEEIDYPLMHELDYEKG